MKFQIRMGNYLKTSNNTSKMAELSLISLIPLIIFSFYKNGLYPYLKGYGNILTIIRPIMIIILPLVVSYFTEYFWYKYIIKKNIMTYKKFKYLPIIIFSLIMPIQTPYYLLIIGSIILSIIKTILDKTKFNYLNYALICKLLIILFLGFILSDKIYLNEYESSLNMISPLKYFYNNRLIMNIDIIKQYSNYSNIMWGFIPSNIIISSNILLIISFIYLLIMKVIKWRASLSYIFTVFIMILIISSKNNINMMYPIFYMIMSSLLFESIYLVGDNESSPITKHGSVIYGIIIGILTVLIKFLTQYGNLSFIMILLVNIFIPLINRFSINLKYNKIIFYVTYILIILITIVLAFLVRNNL